MDIRTDSQDFVILVVEDEALIRLDIDDLLASQGYRTIEAADAGQAIAVLGEGRRVDLVFTDIHMPGSMDGLGLARWVRANHPQIAIILGSGASRPSDLGDDLSDIAPVEEKPYDTRRLLARIRSKMTQRG
jgi:CheY-like chemotaxis protein